MVAVSERIHSPEIESPSPIEPINGNFKNKPFVELGQMDPDSLTQLFRLTDRMKEIVNNSEPSDILAGQDITLLFYEPSTRTRSSFEAAAQRLGASVTVVENPQQFSSAIKGETFEDTIKIHAGYSNTIVLRHPEEGSAVKAAEAVQQLEERGKKEFKTSVINAGDGIGEHPTQALLDLYTIFERYGKLSGLKVLMAGDILNGRTVHSLLEGLSMFPDNEIQLLSPKELKLSPEKLQHYKDKGLKISEINSVDEIDEDSDVWYWTRVQKERMKKKGIKKILSKITMLKNRILRRPNNINKFIADKKLLDDKGPNTVLMHPLPRVGEIPEEVDSDERAIYFEQAQNGMFIRMALLTLNAGREQQAYHPKWDCKKYDGKKRLEKQSIADEADNGIQSDTPPFPNMRFSGGLGIIVHPPLPRELPPELRDRFRPRED